MSNQGLRVRLGLFVALACVLFSVLVVMFGSLPNLFRSSTIYTVRFTEAPGLTPGAPVKRSGVRIGEVQNIELDEELGIVKVRISVRSPYKIRKNEQATLMTGLLGSDASIDFVPKPHEEGEPVDREPEPPGEVLVGARAATVGTLLKGASEVVPTTQETLADIRKSIQRLEKLAARIEKSVPLADETLRSYRDLAKRAQQSIPEFERTNSQAQEVLRSIREVVPEAQRTIEQYRLLGQDARTVLPELMKTNRELLELMQTIRNAVPTVERTVEEFRDLASDVRRALPRVERGIEDVASTARAAQKVIEDLDVFWQKNRGSVEDSLNNLNASLQRIAKMFSDENLNRFTNTLTNISTASDQFPKISRNTATSSEQFPAISRNLVDVSEQAKTTVRRLNDRLNDIEKPLADLQKTMADVRGVLQDARKISTPLGERASQISRNLDESVEKVNQTLGDVRALMRVIDRSDGILRKVLTDPTLYNNIDCAVSMVVRMIPRLDRILKDFETFADKLARHPELIGAGGALRPSNGLKNPATPPVSTQPHMVPTAPTPVIHQPGYPPRR